MICLDFRIADFKDQQRDGDGEHTIAEGFQPCGVNCAAMGLWCDTLAEHRIRPDATIMSMLFLS